MENTAKRPDTGSAPRRRVYPARMLIAWFIPQAAFLLVCLLFARPTSLHGALLPALVLAAPALVTLAICVIVHPVLVALERTRIRHYLLGYLLALHPLFLHAFFLGSVTSLGLQSLTILYLAALALPLLLIFWWLHHRVLQRLRF